MPHYRSLARRRLGYGMRCLSLLAVQSVVADASAQVENRAENGGENTAAGESEQSRVERLLARGIQSREAGRDTEALELYRQAAALQPDNPRVLAHLGATYHALGRWVSAHTYLKQALQFRDDPYILRHRGELEEALSTVADHIGFLEVYGAPAGAEALINGQTVATLPMAAPVPVTVGSYVLEVRFENHYTLGRPITIGQRVLTREEVELTPHLTGAAGPGTEPGAARPSSAPALQDAASEASASNSSSLQWLPWTLGGLSAAAAATSIIAWERREHYARRWNDDAVCVGVGISRQERCGVELERGQRAETVFWVSGAAAGLFAVGAVVSAVLSPEERADDGSDSASGGKAFNCILHTQGAQCFGTF